MINSLPLVSSDILTPLVRYNLRITLMQSRDYTNILRYLKIGMQFPDSDNAWCNFEIAEHKQSYTLQLNV